MIEVRHVGRIRILSINSPRKANALNEAGKNELADRVSEAGSVPEVDAVVLTGEGERFCAGSDVAEMRGFGSDEMTRMLRAEMRMYRSITACGKPVIAAVNGHALGAGMVLVLCCDFAVAAPMAKFGLPELGIGVAAPLEALLLPQIIGVARAREMFYVPGWLSADQAQGWGLVNRLSPPGGSVEEAVRVASEIVDHAQGVFALQKRLVNGLMYSGRSEDAIMDSVAQTAQLFEGNGPRGRMSLFLEGRRRSK